AVKEEIEELAKICHNEGAILKVILENCLLTKEEIVKACEISDEAGADFVKTSTGFSTSGADSSDVALMKKSVSDRVKVKASGGIRDYKKSLEMIENGADRLGVSAGVKIYKESKSL
ncbi:deoxyribose-phosphate aldolase, partial [Peptoniphilus timonensis]|uniref:deoxyribose-phosphate aldolase n=1 Tax=Peptoniphilus timonensis TaxID=1268254 RepID=UPI0009DAFA58